MIITIESLGGLGDGIASVNSKPVFISKTCKGDVLDVRITHETSEALRGEIVSIATPGEERTTPPCPHFSRCGGCSMQQLSSNAYQNFKRQLFTSALKQAGFSGDADDVIFLPAATRRRAELQLDAGTASLAFYEPRSHNLVPIDSCLILEPSLQALLVPLAKSLSALPGAKQLRSVSFTAADSGIDVLLECYAIPGDENAFAALAKKYNLARIAARLPGGNIHILCEQFPVEMTLGGYPITLPYNAFLQASREGQQFLTDAVTTALHGKKSVADLFCGIGTYSFPLSRDAKIHAVESDPGMVDSLRQNAKRHGLEITAERRDLFKNPLTVKELARFDAVVINPPRPGAKTQSEMLAKSSIQTVVMVSCNQASFARDARILTAGGFTITSAAAIDQFVFSPHLEIVAVFSR